MDDKTKLFNVKNFLKQENGRLSSLNISRDLSLGGTKPKRVFTPNLNAVRNKKGIVPVNNLKEKAKRTSQRQFNNRNDKNGRYVQSSGIFSEGAGEIRRPTLYSEKRAATREHETSSGMVKPKLGNSWDIDIKEEATVVEDLLACDEDSNSENEGEYEPIVLPLAANQDGFMNTFKVKKETNLKIKKEEEFDGYELTSDMASESNITLSSFCRDKMFDDDNIAVSLVKFPDSLPGKGFDDDNKIVDYTVDQMIEGQIGKILVRKSGKIDVVVGKTKYTLDAVEAAAFTEELMCTDDLDETRHEPAVTSLGPIHEKLIISPVWPNLLLTKKK